MEKNSLNVKKLTFLVSFLFITSMGAAQSLSVQTDLTSTNGIQPVKVEDTWHAVECANIKFTLVFTRPELTENQRNLSIKKVTCVFNGEQKNGNLEDNNVFEYSIASVKDYQAATLTLEYSYEEFTGEYERNDEAKPIYTTITAEPLIIYSDKAQIWEQPSAEVDNVEKIYTQTERTYQITKKGGTPQWEYTWNGTQGDASFVQARPASMPGWVTTEIEIKNYAPDGVTEWYRSKINSDSYFYNASIIRKKDVERKNFYKSTGNTTWEVETQDGGSIYEITWTGGETNGSGSTYKPYPSEVISSAENRLIQATVVNKADDGHELYRETISFGEINVYPAIYHESGKTESVVYAGEQVQFAPVNVGGGFPTGWVYAWSNETSEQQITDAPTTSTVYTLRAQNMCDGEVFDSFTETYTATVYPIPSFKTNEKMRIVNAKGQTVEPILEGSISYPETSVVGNDYHVIVGDGINVQCLTTDGVPNGWVYNIFVNDAPIANSSFTPSSAGTYTVKVVATNGEGIVEHPYTGTFTRQYIVYDTPLFVNTTTEIHTYPGKSESFNAPVVGGEETGWTFVWNDGTTGQSINLDAGAVTERTTEVHTLSATYVCEGITRFDNSEAFTLVIWPQPQTTGLTIKLRDKELNKVKNIVYYDKQSTEDKNVSIECYDGDILDISYNIAGGYSAEMGCWTYQRGTEPISDITYTAGSFATGTGSDTFIASNTSQASMMQTFDLIIKNKPNHDAVYSTENVWLNDVYKVNVKIWHRPSITEMNTDSATTAQWKTARVDVYAGGMEANKVAFNVPSSYGNTNNGGWTYSWKEDGTEVSQNHGTWTYTPQSTSASYYTDKILSLHVVNKIGDNYGLDETFEYPIRIWNKAIFDTAFTLTDNNKNGEAVKKGIREGNVSTYKLNRMDDGYFLADSTSYAYDWTLNGKAGDNTAFEFYTVVPSVSTDKGMVTRDVTDELVLSNYGPYGHVWERHKLPSHSYRVYHKPQTPESITKKGNFATGTFAVYMPTSISDTELKTYRYNLVFGYVDASGNDIDLSGVIEQGEAGTVRWYQVPASARSYNNYYVYAEWEYSDGAKITSGKRYLSQKNGSNVDEEWDGSTFDHVNLLTRAFILGFDEVTEIQEIVSDTNQIGGEETINCVYSLNGQLIDNTNNLESGIYLFETIINGKRTVKKVIVK